MTNLMRGEVDFPEGGDGVVLRLSNTDLAGLRKVYGKNWFDEVMNGLQAFDMDVIGTVLKVAPKKDGVQMSVDVLTLSAVPVITLTGKVIDALFLALHGVAFGTFMIDRAKELTRNAADRPPSSPEDTSTI